MAVVSITSEEDLIDTYFIQHLLSKVLLIVVLPDRERHTVAMGHRLHPYFICCADGELARLAEVLRSIARHERPPEPTAPLRNPFEAVMPTNRTGVQHDVRIGTAHEADRRQADEEAMIKNGKKNYEILIVLCCTRIRRIFPVPTPATAMGALPYLLETGNWNSAEIRLYGYCCSKPWCLISTTSGAMSYHAGH